MRNRINRLVYWQKPKEINAIFYAWVKCNLIKFLFANSIWMNNDHIHNKNKWLLYNILYNFNKNHIFSILIWNLNQFVGFLSFFIFWNNVIIRRCQVKKFPRCYCNFILKLVIKSLLRLADLDFSLMDPLPWEIHTLSSTSL